MSNNDLEIKRFMAQKLAEKESLSTIQQEVNEKFGTRMTYMEIRILASELDDVDWKAFDPAPAKPEDEEVKPEDDAKAEAPSGGSGTEVEVSSWFVPVPSFPAL